ncbi:MAG: hypothetical protein HGB11_13295 [Chlorobiales bacterium]|nr:hypothetical protein [Chlorobiales bacterium]
MLSTLGKVAWDRKSYAESREHLQEALGTALRIAAMPLALNCLLTIAEMRILSDDVDNATRFLKVVLHHPKSSYDVKFQAGLLLEKHTGREILLPAGYDELVDSQLADAMLKDISVNILQDRN